MDQNIRPCRGMDQKLYRASEWGDAKVLDEVLKQGTVYVFEAVTPAGDTALHRAAFFGHAKLASKLILKASENPEAGMQFLTAQNTDGNTALHAAAEGGCEQIVEELVKKDGGLACVKNKAGETALFKACEKGHVGIVECLLNYTPEEHDARADGQTALHVAVFELHTGVTAKLLEKRPALVLKADVSKSTALHILALVPLALVPDIKPLRSWPTRKANITRIGKMLLEQEISLMHRVDVNRQSALHLAAKLGNAPLVDVILRDEADCMHISDKDGRTALHLAVQNASQVYARDNNGLSSVRDIISSLATRRLINCSDNDGQTALDIAIQKTREDKQLYWSIRTYLTSHGARQKMFGTEAIEDPSLKSIWRMDIVSVIAALIATVAFQAAFTLPEDRDSFVFKLFIYFNTGAFCCSLGTAVLLIFALFGNQHEDPAIAGRCFRGLWAAMTFTILTFGAAIHLAVARKCMWLAVLVWIKVCYLPIGIRLSSMQGKEQMFTKPRKYTVLIIREQIEGVANALYDLAMPLYVSSLAFIQEDLILPTRRILSWARKKWRKD